PHDLVRDRGRRHGDVERGRLADGGDLQHTAHPRRVLRPGLRREQQQREENEGGADHASASGAIPKLAAACTISSHVVGSTSMPSRSRFSRARRSGSPGTSTGAPASAGGEAFTYATKPSVSRRNQSRPAKRAGSISTVNMLLMTPPSRGLAGWMVGP